MRAKVCHVAVFSKCVWLKYFYCVDVIDMYTKFATILFHRESTSTLLGRNFELGPVVTDNWHWQRAGIPR